MTVVTWGVGGVVAVGAVVAGAFSRPRSDFTRLLSTISSSNFLRLMERDEDRLGASEFLLSERSESILIIMNTLKKPTKIERNMLHRQID